MGTTWWRWKDDSGKQHTIDVDNVLYLSQSPVNILSITILSDQFNYDDGTGINTKRSKSHFYWNHNKHQRTITHPPSNLTELPVNEGFLLAGMYTQMVGAEVFTTKKHCHCHASNWIPNDDDPKRNVELISNILHVGGMLLYTNAGQILYVRIEEISLNKKAVLQLWVRTTNDEVIETKKCFYDRLMILI